MMTSKEKLVAMSLLKAKEMIELKVISTVELWLEVISQMQLAMKKTILQVVVLTTVQ